MTECEILKFALLGIDAEIIRAAELLKSDYELNRRKALFICELSEKRREIGEKLHKIDQENQ